MCTTCQGSAKTAGTTTTIRSIDAQYVNALTQASQTTLSNRSSAAASALSAGNQAATASVVSQLHLTSDNDVLVSSGFATNGSGDVVLSGTISGIPYELHLHVELNDTQVTVSLELTKPIHIGPYTWKFNLGGVVRDTAGNIVGATSITPATDLDVLGGIDWWCIVKCGGVAIAGILVECLPSLVGGPAAFVACVVAKAGSGAAGIAQCVAKCIG